MAGISGVQARVLVICFVGMVVSAPALYATFALLLEPTSRELGWGRSVITGAFLLATPLAAANYVLVGRLLDRFGPRRMLLPGFLLSGVGIALLSQLSGSLVQLFVLQTIVLLFSTITTGLSFGKVIAQHFTHNRGFALGLCLGGGGGFGMAVMPQLGAALLEQFGWRGTYVAVGVLAVVIGCTAAWLLPKDKTAAAVSAQPLEPAVGARQALLSKTFVVIALIGFLSCGAINGIGKHLAALTTDSGQTAAFAATVLSTYAISMMAGQFAIGALLDRIETPRIGVPIFLTVLTGVLFLHHGTSSTTILVGAMLLGAGAGSEYALLPYMLARFFGVATFGLIYGTIYAIILTAGGLGSFLMGGSFDLSGSYGNALAAFEIALVGAAVLVLLLPRYRRSTGEAGTDMSAPAAAGSSS